MVLHHRNFVYLTIIHYHAAKYVVCLQHIRQDDRIKK